MSTRQAAGGRVPTGTMTTEEIKTRILAMFDYGNDTFPGSDRAAGEPSRAPEGGRSVTGSPGA
ncbi:hypothetical protein G6038_12000 [Rhodococcus sp. 14C212]|uniref:hypothetical protein n=1 Tax=Rhodococcus sp. 14C212 TaxID=2711209 RepID=UPI0013EB69CE|nr:hypothetical protein [Rhodococcus sp. 14C212]NGP06189.1 hypothetical protein [Rhodococcus sp. 14C212]